MTCGNQNGQDTEMEGEGKLNIVFPQISTHILLNALPEKVPTQGQNIKQAPPSKKGAPILLHFLKY